MIATTGRGIFAKMGATVMRLLQTEYIVGATVLGLVNDNRTSRNLPKPPVGWSIAATNPPTLLPFPRPACQVGTATAADAKAAPRRWAGAYMNESPSRKT